MNQGVLFGVDNTAVDRAGLVVGVKKTIELLEADGILTDRHQAKVQGMIDLARDICMARPGSIAKINGFRLLHEQLSELLELEAPAGGADDPGNRITKLSEYLNQRRLESYSRDAEEA